MQEHYSLVLVAVSQGAANSSTSQNNLYSVAISTSVTGVRMNETTGISDSFSQTKTESKNVNKVQLVALQLQNAVQPLIDP